MDPGEFGGQTSGMAQFTIQLTRQISVRCTLPFLWDSRVRATHPSVFLEKTDGLFTKILCGVQHSNTAWVYIQYLVILYLYLYCNSVSSWFLPYACMIGIG